MLRKSWLLETNFFYQTSNRVWEKCLPQFLQSRFALSELSTEAATRGVLWKKMFLGISQNSQENTCVSGLQLY